MKKVAILAAPGFEEIELMAPLDILRRLNMDVVLAGVQSDKVVSTHEVTVSTDTMLDKLQRRQAGRPDPARRRGLLGTPRHAGSHPSGQKNA